MVGSVKCKETEEEKVKVTKCTLSNQIYSPVLVSKVPRCSQRNFRVNLGPISLNATRFPSLNWYLKD